MRLATVEEFQTGSGWPVIALENGAHVSLEKIAVQLDLVGTDEYDCFLNMELALARLELVQKRVQEWLKKYGEEHVASVKRDRKLGLQSPNFLPPVQHPRSFRDFYSFEEHVKTCRAKRGLEMPPAWYEVPVFYFSNAGSLVGHEQPVCAPAGSQELDYELELGAIIAKGGRDIPEEEALEHIAGFTIVNDLSARDLQRKEMSVGLGPAKGKDFATAVGPYLVTLDEFQDRIDEKGRVALEMKARVNGKVLSQGNASSMYHSWPKLIAQASRDAELFPGDLIGSGTVGTGCILELGPENTGGWLKPGDVVELEIERLGVLRTPIVARP